MQRDPAADIKLEHAMGRLLQAGVLLSAAIMAAGGLFYLMRHGGEVVNFRQFHAAAAPDSHVLRLGILIMIATPVLRVLFAVVAFAKERDRLYTLVSVVVLGLLAWSLRGFL